MSRAAEPDEIVGINWGSSNFRAYRIAADGDLIDEFSEGAGIAQLDRPAMAGMIGKVSARWPGRRPIYASGMIGSNIGWAEVPYAEAPTGRDALVQASREVEIGDASVRIVPGIACSRTSDSAPDVLRGEEVELLGLIDAGYANGLAVLPGTHTKWVWLDGERVSQFFTSMSGEIFDRLTGQGLLASIVEGDGVEGEPFLDGVAAGQARALGLSTLLFGARALVLRGRLKRGDAASYIRGLLIGSELADALAAFPDLAGQEVPLVGNAPLARLYASALEHIKVPTRFVDSRDACLRGFRALHEARK